MLTIPFPPLAVAPGSRDNPAPGDPGWAAGHYSQVLGQAAVTPTGLSKFSTALCPPDALLTGSDGTMALVSKYAVIQDIP